MFLKQNNTQTLVFKPSEVESPARPTAVYFR